MKVAFTPEAWVSYLYWQKMDQRILKRINELIKDILRQPYGGLGKPEPLKFELRGLWSRRINSEHRLVYHVQEEVVTIISARFHY